MPGVPPNAMGSLKRVFKGLFKRGKKNTQQDAPVTEQTPPSDTVEDMKAVSPVNPTSEIAPQLPPMNQASPLQNPSMEGTSKPLPPTHPLATGQHSQPQEAVPQNYETRSQGLARMDTKELVESRLEASRSGVTAAGQTTKGDVGLGLQNNDTSDIPQNATQPVETSPVNPVGAPDDDVPPLPPPKTDSAIGVLDQSDAGKENALPAVTGETPTTNEKVAVMHEEPPPIKAVKAAPGMSATSGPLEDFPEGGIVHDEETHI